MLQGLYKCPKSKGFDIRFIVTIKITPSADCCFHIVMYLDFSLYICIGHILNLHCVKTQISTFEHHRIIDLSSFYILKYPKHTIKIMQYIRSILRNFV